MVEYALLAALIGVELGDKGSPFTQFDVATKSLGESGRWRAEQTFGLKTLRLRVCVVDLVGQFLWRPRRRRVRLIPVKQRVKRLSGREP